MSRFSRLPLWPLVPLYGAAVALKNFGYATGWCKPSTLRWPVVSVGNLSVGGAGKTPVVIELARLLHRAGVQVDVLSRGYGRRGRETLRVEPEGSVTRLGDEPLLIASAARVPVFVGPGRLTAGRLAEATFATGTAPRVHLLDDGFQHRQLARKVDIVVLHASDLAGRLLPVGRMREPLRSLRRADVVILRAEDEDVALRARQYMRPGSVVWRVRRSLRLPPGLHGAIAFCAIAHPAEFFTAVRQAGATLVANLPWRDHHAYTAGDVQRLTRLAQVHGAGAFVTTAKDAVRLSPALRAALEQWAPVVIADLDLRFEQEAQVLDQLLQLLGFAASPPLL